MMARTFNQSLREGFFKPDFFATKTTEKLKSDIEALEENLRKMRRENRSNKEIDQYIEDSLLEIQSRHWADNRAIREKAEAELAALGERWKRKNDGDAARALLERQRFESRYKLMDDDAMTVEAQNYLDAEALEISPDRLEVLALELERREGTRELAHILTKKMAENNYTEPWRYTDAGDKLVETIQAHDTEYGQLFVSPDGGSLVTLDIEDLINTEVRDD